MHPQWQAFLEQHGAHSDGAMVTDFGDPAGELHQLETGRVLCDLSYLTLVSVQGEDATAFLQGQFCNDVREVNERRSQLSGYCSPRGRLLASFRIFMHGGRYYLRLPASLGEDLLKRLRLYVLRSRVLIEPAGTHWIGIGYAGAGADTTLHKILGEAPTHANDVISTAGCVVLRLPGPRPRFEIYGEPDALQRLWATLATEARPAGAGIWSLLDIRAGIPTIYPQTVEAFVPQMVNMQRIDAVSFTKGCYPGQEVVARMQYLGKLKRRMYRARIVTDCAPRAGDLLSSTHTGTGEDAGMIVDAQPAAQGCYEVLAVVQTANVGSGEIRIGGPQGAALDFLDLPYPLSDPAQQLA